MRIVCRPASPMSSSNINRGNVELAATLRKRDLRDLGFSNGVTHWPSWTPAFPLLATTVFAHEGPRDPLDTS